MTRPQKLTLRTLVVLTLGLLGYLAYGLLTPAETAYAARESRQDVNDLTRLGENIAALDASELRACAESTQCQAEVKRDRDLAERVVVRGTPPLVLGDKGFEAPSYAELVLATDTKLKVELARSQTHLPSETLEVKGF